MTPLRTAKMGRRLGNGLASSPASPDPEPLLKSPRRRRKLKKGPSISPLGVTKKIQKEVQNPGSSNKTSTPILHTFVEKIRPMLDVIDKLRGLGVGEEGIPVPSIVVVGDQSCGKSSVLASLAGIDLPRGKGIVTRVPLILHLKKAYSATEESITIQYVKGDSTVQRVLSSEDLIESAVCEATNDLAGESVGICNKPINVIVSKYGAPDLTLVDLPGITRVPVAGQPRDIYDQVASMIRSYISPEESVILNVLSAEVDFSTCESIAMSQKVDPKGERTLAVVTKIDRAPEGLYEKVMGNAVHVGLGYVCVKNRTTNVSFEEARRNETEFFSSHVQLSSLPRSMVGISSLAQRLAAIQAERIMQCMPRIQQQIRQVLFHREQELKMLPQGMNSDAEAFAIFHQLVTKRRQKMEGLISGNYAGCATKDHHFAARLDESFTSIALQMMGNGSKFLSAEYHAVCLRAMNESKGVSLPNILSPTVIQELINCEVDKLAPFASSCVEASFRYAQDVALDVVKQVAEGYPKLMQLFSHATTSSIESAKDRCTLFADRIIKKEKSGVYTNNHYYMDTVNKIRKQIEETRNTPWPPPPPGMFLKAGEVPQRMAMVNDLEPIPLTHLVSNADQAARDMQINLFAYWKVVVKRVADVIPMEIKFALKESLLDEIDSFLFSKSLGRTKELMQEEPVVKQKRVRLERSIAVLKEGSEHVGQLCF